MVRTAFLAALAYFICYGGNQIFGQNMMERPIVVGAVTGLFLGDLELGIKMGAALEAIFMGSVLIGGALSAEPASATVFAIVFAITQNIDVDAALALAVPIGIIAAFVTMFFNNVFLNIFNPLSDKAADKNNAKTLVFYHYLAFFIRFGIMAVILFIGVMVGSEPVSNFVNNIPDVVLRAMKATGGLLPAVGFAILIKMLWSVEIAAYYFLGFIMVAYLKLPQIAIAAIGLIIVVLSSYRDISLKKNMQVSDRKNINDVEDFFE